MSSAHVETRGAATVIVAWRTTSLVHGRVVEARGSVVEHLRRYAEETAQTISTAVGQPYDPDGDLGESQYFTASRDDLLDAAVVDVLAMGEGLPAATQIDLDRTLAFYALLLGNDPRNRSAFIKKGNPIKLGDKDLVAVFDQGLTRITQPILSFNPDFDVVVTADGVWAFDKANFEGLFKETAIVLAKTDGWVEQLSSAIPIASASKVQFASRLRVNSVLRKKVLGILRSPHIARLTPAEIRSKMKFHGLDPELLMEGDELVFTREHEGDLLHLLNEDLFTGDFTGEQYAAARKLRRR
jgi:hypothetical protein